MSAPESTSADIVPESEINGTQKTDAHNVVLAGVDLVHWGATGRLSETVLRASFLSEASNYTDCDTVGPALRNAGDSSKRLRPSDADWWVGPAMRATEAATPRENRVALVPPTL